MEPCGVGVGGGRRRVAGMIRGSARQDCQKVFACIFPVTQEAARKRTHTHTHYHVAACAGLRAGRTPSAHYAPSESLRAPSRPSGHACAPKTLFALATRPTRLMPVHIKPNLPPPLTTTTNPISDITLSPARPLLYHDCPAIHYALSPVSALQRPKPIYYTKCGARPH